MSKPKKQISTIVDKLGARPDTIDFRDLLFVPTLVEIPSEIKLEDYQKLKIPVLDQGTEGACTGFGLATVVNYLLRVRKVYPDKENVSPRMLYEIAKNYDEWEGTDYSGSSARGAINGWHKHGVASEKKWPYKVGDKLGTLNAERIEDANKRPLGAYFRVNHKDLVAMHCALAEVGILFVTSEVHDGWEDVKSDGRINYDPDKNKIIGGHAFAIVGYNEEGFWFQNSWGTSWGKDGFGFITYDDWSKNGTDVWVARLAVHAVFKNTSSQSFSFSLTNVSKSAQLYNDLKPHIVNIGNDGKLSTSGPFGNTEEDIKNIFHSDIPSITNGWSTKRILLYAHGGLTEEDRIIQKLSNHKKVLLENNIYPLIFVWHTGFWDTLKNMIEDEFKKIRSESIWGDAKDFMLDRMDDTLEILLRPFGRKFWDEMKENAGYASTKSDGGAAITIKYLSEILNSDTKYEINTIGHSAGSIFLAYFTELFFAQNPAFKIKNNILWAPAVTVNLFREKNVQFINSGNVQNTYMFNLEDQVERDDNCAGLYNKSLLYLVSNSFEEYAKIPFVRDGTPILGMDKFVQKDRVLMQLIKAGKIGYTLSPDGDVTQAKHHGDFDDDPCCLKTALGIMLKSQAKSGKILVERMPSKFAIQQRKKIIEKSVN